MKSYLAKFSPSVGNHIVTALTQESVNNTAKEYLYLTGDEVHFFALSILDDSENTVYFSVGKDTDMSQLPEPFPSELKRSTLYDELSRLNLFSISSDEAQRTDEQKQALSTAYNDYYLDSAFSFTSGLPSCFTPEELLKFNPVELIESTDPLNCGAIYTQCFSEVVIVEIKESRRRLAVCIKKQTTAKEAWTIRYKALFNLQSTEYSKLPDDVKRDLNEHFNNIPQSELPNMFEISQLFLDLSNLSRASAPEIDGIDKTTELNLCAAVEEYIHLYLENALVNGYTVTPSAKNTFDYLVKPVKYTFSVTKSPDKDDRYKTLNYIMSTTQAGITPQNYDWEWVNPSDPDLKSGVTAIDRDIFFEIFNEKYKTEILSGLRKHFTAEVKAPDHTIFSLTYYYGMSSDSSQDSGEFVFNDGENKYKYPQYSYNSKSDFVSFYIPPFFAGTTQFELDYKFDCSAVWGEFKEAETTYPAIIYSNKISLYMDLAYDSGHSTGYIVNREIDCSIGFKIDEYGKITLIKSVDDRDLGGKIDISGWSAFATFGEINQLINDITSTVNKWLSNSISAFKNNFAKNFLAYSNWVMLGNKTFSFSKESFSDYGDFCTNVKYVNPMTDEIMKKISNAPLRSGRKKDD